VSDKQQQLRGSIVLASKLQLDVTNDEMFYVISANESSAAT
jgi:hypothetical protein